MDFTELEDQKVNKTLHKCLDVAMAENMFLEEVIERFSTIIKVVYPQQESIRDDKTDAHPID